MKPDQLNAFTDGVIAIIITIMVLEIRLPGQATWGGVKAMAPFLGIYALSFVNIGIFWNNHHHLMQGPKKIDGRVLWANLSLLFWLSLVPYEIRWMGEAGIVAWPVAAYGGVLMMAAISYMLLERALVAADGERAGSRRKRPSPQGMAQLRCLRSRVRPRIRGSADFGCTLCFGLAGVVHPGPALRAQLASLASVSHLGSKGDSFGKLAWNNDSRREEGRQDRHCR